MDGAWPGDARTQDTGKYRTLPRSPPGHHHRQHRHPRSPATDCILSPSPGNIGSQSHNQWVCGKIVFPSDSLLAWLEWLIKSTHYMPAQSHDLYCVSKGYKSFHHPCPDHLEPTPLSNCWRDAPSPRDLLYVAMQRVSRGGAAPAAPAATCGQCGDQLMGSIEAGGPGSPTNITSMSPTRFLILFAGISASPHRLTVSLQNNICKCQRVTPN